MSGGGIGLDLPEKVRRMDGRLRTPRPRSPWCKRGPLRRASLVCLLEGVDWDGALLQLQAAGWDNGARDTVWIRSQDDHGWHEEGQMSSHERRPVRGESRAEV